MAPPPEIAIPSTSVSGQDTSKPFTLYNITLRLPLRSFVVQKRYSDFSKLHTDLTQQVGAPPPETLPGKLWLKSTVGSPQLTHDRQVGLERYLKAVAESPDRRWRDTSAWRAFLSLPSSSTTNSAVSAGGMIGNAAAGAADPGTWLDIHRELKHCLHEARQCLSRRDGAVDGGNGNSSAAIEAGAAAKRALIKSGNLIVSLGDGLKKVQDTGRLGDGELRRRRDLLSAGRIERDGLEKLVNTIPNQSEFSQRGKQGQSSTADKTALLKGGRPSGRVLGAPLQETAKTRELDNEGVLLLQKREMAAQDQQLDQLTAIIRRQKEMGVQINDEVERQTEMLSAMDADTDRVDAKLKVANNRIRKF